MQFKFFRIPIPDSGGFAEELNAFLAMCGKLVRSIG
jgi:hypothetical protein